MNLSTDILLVEDDPGDVRLALAVFRALKVADRCVVVNDGEQALDFLHLKGRFSKRPPGLPRLILRSDERLVAGASDQCFPLDEVPPVSLVS